MHRIEPVQPFGRGAVGNTGLGVAFAERPQADLIEVVEAKGASDGIDQDGVWDGQGNDIGQIDGEEVGGADEGFVVNVAD